MRSPLVGPAYQLYSPDLASQACINLYLETVEDKLGGARNYGALYGTPGLDLSFTVGSGPIRGMRVVGQYLYVVSGATLYRVNSLLMATAIGTLSTSTGNVSMKDNGTGGGGAPATQVAIFDANGGYVYAGGVFMTQVMPFSGPIGGFVWQDGFGVVSQAGTYILWMSNANDLTTWQALNFATEEGQSDNIVTLGELHRQILVFKERNTAVYINAGQSGFTFQRLDGVYIPHGCLAGGSVARTGDQLVWLSQSSNGGGAVLAMRTYEALRVSNYAVEQHWQSFATMTDAVAYAYQQNGHEFYVLTFPTAGETWVCDLTETARLGYGIWHQRGYFSNGAYSQHRSNTQAYFRGLNLVGDYQTGSVYAYDVNTYTDNGQPIRRLRSWRALPMSTADAMPFKSLEIDMETGVGVPPTSSPNLMLRWSDDGGYNWSNGRIGSAGLTGATGQRIKFNRLGAARRGLQSDRTFELSTIDPFKIAWMGAEVNDGEHGPREVAA